MSITAERWLADRLLPIAVRAAGLTEGTTLELLEGLGLPALDEVAFDAGDRCRDLTLLDAAALAVRLAPGNTRALRLQRAIEGLAARDAKELEDARELLVDVPGVPEYEDRHIAAIEARDRWRASQDDAQEELLRWLRSINGQTRL